MISSVAGVTASGWTTIPPLYPFRSAGRDISIEGQDYNPAGPPHAELRVIGPQYFSTLGVPVLEGHEFTAFDDENAAPKAIVNRALARHYWPDQSAIGRRLRIDGPASTQPWLTIVGVVGDVHQLSRSTPSVPEMYMPYLGSPRRSVFLVVRTKGPPEQLLTPLKQAIWSVDRNLPATRFRTMDQATTEDVFPQRMMSNVLGVLSLFALLLAALGTYAIVSHAVSGRRQELAVRTTVGATRRDLIGLVFRQMSIAVTAGLVLGLGLALGLARSMQGLLFGIAGLNPATVLLTTGILIVCAVMAIYIPARRAASVDPMAALRQE